MNTSLVYGFMRLREYKTTTKKNRRVRKPDFITFCLNEYHYQLILFNGKPQSDRFLVISLLLNSHVYILVELTQSPEEETHKKAVEQSNIAENETYTKKKWQLGTVKGLLYANKFESCNTIPMSQRKNNKTVPIYNIYGDFYSFVIQHREKNIIYVNKWKRKKCNVFFSAARIPATARIHNT